MNISNKHTNRRDALLWWKNLGIHDQLQMIKNWKTSLNHLHFKIGWTYSMIIASSSTIEEIYNTHLGSDASRVQSSTETKQ